MKKLILLILLIYKNTFSKVLVKLFGNGCRYTPTCSEYAAEAITKFGVMKGSKLALSRFLRCHPFSKHDHHDPVPEGGVLTN